MPWVAFIKSTKSDQKLGCCRCPCVWAVNDVASVIGQIVDRGAVGVVEVDHLDPEHTVVVLWSAMRDQDRLLTGFHVVPVHTETGQKLSPPAAGVDHVHLSWIAEPSAGHGRGRREHVRVADLSMLVVTAPPENPTL